MALRLKPKPRHLSKAKLSVSPVGKGRSLSRDLSCWEGPRGREPLPPDILTG